jgi:hypothetical protein
LVGYPGSGGERNPDLVKLSPYLPRLDRLHLLLMRLHLHAVVERTGGGDVREMGEPLGKVP